MLVWLWRAAVLLLLAIIMAEVERGIDLTGAMYSHRPEAGGLPWTSCPPQ